MKYLEVLLNEQEIEVLERELGFILETELRSATTKTIISNILEKIK